MLFKLKALGSLLNHNKFCKTELRRAVRSAHKALPYCVAVLARAALSVCSSWSTTVRATFPPPSKVMSRATLAFVRGAFYNEEAAAPVARLEQAWRCPEYRKLEPDPELLRTLIPLGITIKTLPWKVTYIAQR